jgi:hypothetical protein
VAEQPGMDPLWPKGGRPPCSNGDGRPTYLAGLCGPCYAAEGHEERRAQRLTTAPDGRITDQATMAMLGAKVPAPRVQIDLSVAEAQALLEEPRGLHYGAQHAALYAILARALLDAGVAIVEAPVE